MTRQELPKAYDFKSTEPRIYAMWEAGKYFKPHNDPNAESWMPGQMIEPFDALHAYTLGAAQLSFSQHLRGSLEPGKGADMA